MPSGDVTWFGQALRPFVQILGGMCKMHSFELEYERLALLICLFPSILQGGERSMIQASHPRLLAMR